MKSCWLNRKVTSRSRQAWECWGNSPKPQQLTQASLTLDHSHGAVRVTGLDSAEALEGTPESMLHPGLGVPALLHCSMQNHTEVQFSRCPEGRKRILVPHHCRSYREAGESLGLTPGWENRDFVSGQNLSTRLRYGALICGLESEAL